MGIGQNRPVVIFIPSQTPCQSAWVMNPSSGVKPPIPNITRSPASRDEIATLGSDSARDFSFLRAAPSRSRAWQVARTDCADGHTALQVLGMLAEAAPDHSAELRNRARRA